MTDKHVLEAQRILRMLDGTPIRMDGDRKIVQVTYDYGTYNALLSILFAVANLNERREDYHRNKI